MKRRIIAMLLAIVMLVGNVPVQAFATETQQETAACITEGCEYAAGHEGHCSNYVEPAADASVYMTVSNRGELGMAHEEITVSDRNEDGKLSVDEALYAAHTAYGKGYASENGTVTKLWDVETTNVSFFVNHTPISADVTAETIGSGDYLVASVDQDGVNDYDKYSRFDVMERTVTGGSEFTMYLTDDDGNALAGMEIGLWNGSNSTTMTGLTTDADGSVVLTLDQEGQYCVTAKGTVVETSVDISTLEMTSFEAPIVAPVCVVTVEGSAVQEPVAVYTGQEAVSSVSETVVLASEGETALTWSGTTITLASGTTLGAVPLSKVDVYKQVSFEALPITAVTQKGNTIYVVLAEDTDPSLAVQAGFATSAGGVRLSQSNNKCTLTDGVGEMNVSITAITNQPIVSGTFTIHFSIPMGTAYAVTPPTGEGFTFTGKDSVYEGADYAFTLSVNEGYDGSNLVVKVNGEPVTGDNGTYTVAAVAEDLIITVEGIAVKERGTVTLTEGEGYTISSDDIAYKGEDYTFTVVPDSANYKADTLRVLLDGEPMTGENGVYTIPALNQEHVVTVSIDKKAEYAVTKTGMDGVTITGADTVLETDPYTFSVSVDNAYDSSTMVITVNGEPITLAADGSYTIASAEKDIAIEVTGVKAKVIYDVTLTEGEGYTISGQATSYAGEPYTFTVTVDDAIYFADQIVVKVNGETVTLTDGKYTMEALDGNKTVTVETVVERKRFTVTKPEVEGVTVTGNDDVREGKDYTFSISVDNAYDSTAMVVSVNDQPVNLTDGSYTIASVADNITITVEGITAKTLYNITLNSGKGYTISGAAAAYQGDSYTFTVAVAAGYVGDAMVVTANGETVTGTNGSYTITVAGDTVIEVSGVELTPLPETELAVTDNVIDITDKKLNPFVSYHATATDIQISGATVTEAYENGTIVYMLLSSDTDDNASIDVSFGWTQNKCTMEGSTGSTTLENGEGSLNMTLTASYNNGWKKASADYTLIFRREEPSTEPPICIKPTDSAEIDQGNALTLDLENYFTDADTYYLVEGESKTRIDGSQYSVTPNEAGTLTLVFAAENEAGECSQKATVTVTVKAFVGTWINHSTSNGSIDYVVFTDASGAHIDGVEASYADNKITVVLPKTYDLSGRVTATFTRTANESDLPFLTPSNAFNRAYNQRTDVYTDTLNGGGASRTIYLYNSQPKATNNSYVTWTIAYSMQNDLPVLAEGVAATAEAGITAGENYTLKVSDLFTDADGDSLTYFVSINGAAPVNADADYSYTTDIAGTYTLVFTANDGKGTSAETYTVTLTVKDAEATYSMTVSVPEGLEPKFYVSAGYGEDGLDIQGAEVKAEAAEPAEGLTVYTLTYPVNAGSICVRAEGWGGMAFAAAEGTSVSLRQVTLNVVDYDNNAAESTNTVTYDGHTAAAGTEGWLLVTGTEYTYRAAPQDTASLETAETKEILAAGAQIHTVNLMLGMKDPITITVPADAEARLYKYDTSKYYVASELEAKIVKDNADGTKSYFFVGNTRESGSCFIYRVTKPGKVTKAGYMGWGKLSQTVTYTDADKSNTYRLDDYSGTGQANSGMAEDSVLLNINGQNHLSMNVGDTKILKAYRVWELIKISYQNYIITPDFTYTILSGADVVSLTEKDSPSVGEGDWMTLTALKEGTAVIEVTYDAMEITGGSYDGVYGASDPARTGLVVVQVGGNDTSVSFGIDGFSSRGTKGSKNISYDPNNKRAWDAEFDTLYFTENSGRLTFAPTAQSAISQVAVSNDKGASWTALTQQDGAYTAEILPGNNILRVTTETGVAYQVVRGDKVTALITEAAGDGDGAIEPGETVRVTLKGLHMPIPKMAGNYNPGFGGNNDGFSSTHLNYTVNGQTVSGSGSQYDFITAANYLDIVIPEDIQTDKLTLTDGYIGVGVLGLTRFDEGGDSHRNIPDSGCGTRENQTTFHTRSVLPQVTISIEGLPVSVTGVTLDKTELTLTVGETQNLTATVAPDNADNKAVKWSTSAASVATAVDGQVKAIGPGTAVITVTTEDGQKTASCTVTVKPVPVETAEVYFSVSHDAEFMQVGDQNTVVALRKLTVPYFDLTQYGLGDFSLPQTHADYGKPTMLHLYIYATEVFQCGVAPEEAGEGYLYDQIGSDLFAFSGSAGSFCLDQFWGMDMNLNYYHNYAFPADASGYGITADRVVLEDGDIVTIGHFTSWSFFNDPTSIFHYIVAGEDTVVTTAAQNETLTLKVYRAGPDLGSGGSNTPMEAVRDIYYAEADSLTSGKVTSWTKLGTTDETGKLEADISDLPVGRYVLAVAGQAGVGSSQDIVSTPGGIVLHVTQSTLSAAVQNVVRLIKEIGQVTLEKQSQIEAARSAYDALTDAEKETVSNYAVLEAAEQTLEELRQGQASVQAVMDKIDAIGEVTLDSEAKIREAREAYGALTDAQKELVTNYETLTAAEAALNTLMAAEADKEAAKTVTNLIEGIGEVTLSSEEEINAARAAYEMLTDVQKTLVTNYDVLTEAEETLRLLKLSNADIANIYQNTGNYLAGLAAPGVASINGEWRVIGLARSGRSVPGEYYDAVVAYVKEKMDDNGRLHIAKSSDNSRVILALTAIGKDVTDVGGYDLLSGLDEMKYIGKQGLNGYIWALLAFDSHDYPIPAGDVSRDALVDAILEKQLPDGGWALAGGVSDPDMTGMALAALAPYQSEAAVAEAVEKALSCLSAMQNSDGTFSSVTEGTTCESLAQVITGLTALGIDPETDSRFLKNGVSAVDALASFYVEGGGFRHGLTGERNMMATEQGYYALASYYRLLQEKTSLYDMSDVKLDKEAAADVDAMIDAIGTVTIDSGAKIAAARNAYKALTENQKAMVTKLSVLVEAEKAYAQKQEDYQKNREEAERVEALIELIGTVTLSQESEKKIRDARTAYAALDPLTQQPLVGGSYLAKLEAAETELAQKKQEKADADAVDNVISKINKIPTNRNINLSDETVIQDARKAYDALRNDTLRNDVTNRQLLFNAESALNLLKSTVSVTFTLKGCSKHGANGTVHTLAGGNLNTWISKTCSVKPGSTVKDLLELVLGKENIENPTGNYVESIRYNGVWLGEFDNGQNSGWMYTLNGHHSSLGVAQQSLKSGDVVVFHYSDDFTKEEGSEGNTSTTTTSSTTNYITTTANQLNTETAENVDRLIEDIGEEITLDSEAKILAARAAYDKLTEAQKQLVKKYEELVAAEAKLAELKGNSVENVYLETGDYLQDLGTPGVGTIGGEWMVIGLARSGRSVPTGYYDHVLNYVRENINDAEQLHSAKSSDNSRLVLALTAIGKDVTNVDGHDLLKGLNDMAYIQKQGINGPIWALLAFDSGNYPVPEGDVSRAALIRVILDAQLSDGGWALSGERSDPDMTGMAIQALAPYMESDMDVKKAVEEAIWTLSEMQNDNGSFSSVDGPNSESIAQVITALAALGIDADTDARFVKNGISALDALLTYYIPGGGFRHVLDGNLDGMSTEQSYYALVAYNRMKQNQNFLYDMTDVIDRGGDVIAEEIPEPVEIPEEPVSEEETDNGNAVVIWTAVMAVCAAAAAVLLLNRKKLFGKFQ